MSKLRIPGRKEPLRIGFVPATDCAPVVYAYEAGLFSKYDLNAELQRELSWANIRDKVIDGELDAAHAPATLPFMANIATEEDPCLCVSAMVLSLQGNAITVSRQLFDRGVMNPETLREYIFSTWGKRTCTFAVGALWSTQTILLRQWLESGAINPELHVRIVTIPPEQLFPTLKLGYIDGYCASEPWTSVAVQSGQGVCLATSTDLAPMHPEKVLVVRNSFATGRPDEHERMLAALIEACQFCDQPKNRPFLVNMLSHPHYANAPEEALSAALIGPFSTGFKETRHLDLSIFHRQNANDPTDDKAEWILGQLYRRLDGREQKSKPAPVLRNAFRRDIFLRAKALVREETQELLRSVHEA